jgi:hypothetical protein
VQVVLVAPFLMRFRLGARTFGGEVGARLAAAVQDTLPGYRADDAGPDSPMLFDHHRDTGGSRLGGKKTVGTVDIPDVGPVWIRFDPSGVCHLARRLDVPDRDTMHRRELELALALEEHVTRWVDDVSAAMLASRLVDPASEDAMEAGKLLWWHRVLLDPPRGEEPAATRAYGVERKIHDDAWLRFGDGFTTLIGLPDHRLGEVVRGLMAATDEWIAIDESNRLISGRLRRLDAARWTGIGDIHREFEECLRLGKDLALRDMVRLEESRYTVNASGVVVSAAFERWNMERERAALEVQLQALRDSVDFHRTLAQSRRDERRNRMLFVFTAIALFQSVLVWYDFAHQDLNTLAPAPRLAICVTIAVLTLTVITATLLTRRRTD